jgi:uncharacterized protein YllA (UPF0747 family)|tara:strand:- start:478 stop:672 length:195 start_codon:yes stop_codon:yes gene_type:complete
MIDINKNILKVILEIIEEEKEIFKKENNYIKIMDLLLEQKKQIEQLRKTTKEQVKVIDKLCYGL